MKSFQRKRGLSPVIATILLISLALILAVIIFLWAQSFIGEKIQKDGDPIEDSCPQVVFEADLRFVSGTLFIDIVNQGSIPIYRFDVRTISSGSIDNLNAGVVGADIGSNAILDLGNSVTEGSGDKILIVPVLLGSIEEGQDYYICENEFGLEKVA